MNNDVVNTYNELLKRLSDTGKALENNAQLYDSEVITKDEFETKKSNIFNKENIYVFTNKIVDKKVDNICDSEKTEYIYNQALKLYPKAESIDDYNFILNQLRLIQGYKDSNKIYDDCKNKIKEEEYKEACQISQYDNISDLKRAIEKFNTIIDYKDSQDRINEIETRIESIKKENKEIKDKKDRRRISIVINIIAITVIVTMIILLTTLVFVPHGRQNNIKTLITEGKYEEAQNLIDENGSFGETKKLEVMCEAGEAFEDLDYEKGIKEICSIGGSVTIYYDSNGTTIDKESEVITSFDSINNSIYKKGYKDYKWVLTNYSININDYTAIIYLKAECLEAIKYYISYNLNGGEFNTSYDKKYTVESEDITIPNPTKKGYAFLGWISRTITTPTKDVVIESGSTGGIILTATWQANEYTMYLDENNGNAPAVRSVTYNCSYSLPTLATKVGYDAYWYDENNDKYYSSSITYNQDSNLYLKAKYVLHNYKIKYDLNGGENSTNNPSAYTTESKDIKLQEPTKEGYSFAGWSGTDITNKSTNIEIVQGTTGDREYAANWEPIDYTITYNGLEGANSINNPETYNIETETFTLNNPTKNYYDFVGWSEMNSSSNSLNTQVLKGSIGNKIYTANWKAIEYTITYNLNNGTNNSNNPAIYTYETDTITLQDPTRKGSIFLGWTTFDITNPTKNLTITKNSTGAKEYTANWEVYYTFIGSTENSLCFGLYPQTFVYDNTLISTLNTKASTLPTSESVYGWTDYGEHSSGYSSGHMYYIDIDNNNDGVYDYRGVYFTQYRSYTGGIADNLDSTFQDNNGYTTNTIYWFKYEQIIWDILKTENGKSLIISRLILDSQDYYYSTSSRSGATDYQGNTTTNTVYANNYMYSHIRSWLNTTFYETAFNTLEKEIIETAEVDNSSITTATISNSYACSNTNDKIFLLSYAEAERYYSSYSERRAKGSNYAESQGLWESTSSSYYGYSYYWLRSPASEYNYGVKFVYYNGGLYNDYYGSVFYSNIGVRPACWINL